MQKLSVSEVESLQFKRGFTSLLVEKAKQLNIGEAIVFKREELGIKTNPSAYIGQSFRKNRTDMKFSTKRVADGSYALIRIK
jgi:hypothetical protein